MFVAMIDKRKQKDAVRFNTLLSKLIARDPNRNRQMHGCCCWINNQRKLK